MRMKINKSKDKIAVLMGGISHEREISLKTGRGISDALRSLDYNVFEIDTAENFMDYLKKIKPAVAMIALHGKYGEGGQIQGVLEIMGIPYTGSGVLASSLSLDKGKSKDFLKYLGVRTPDYVVIDTESNIDEILLKKLEYPIVVKPCHEGSSLGFSLVQNRKELAVAVAKAAEYENHILIEQYISGRELTVGLIGDPPMVLPPVEIIPGHNVFDFDCKYTKGMTDYICPAKIDAKARKELQKTASLIHCNFNCHGLSRIDFMMDEKGLIYTLEINTIPGMTETSLLPMMAKKAGYNYESLCETILLSALETENRH